MKAKIVQRETFLDRLPKEIKDELLDLRNQQGKTEPDCVEWLRHKANVVVPRTTLSDWFLRQRRTIASVGDAPKRQFVVDE